MPSTLGLVVQRLLLPVLIGLIAAQSILLWAPHWVLPTPASPATLSNDSSASSSHGMSGPVSYADAVERAAPAVVNVFTRKRVERKRHPLFDDPFFRQFFRSTREPSARIQSSLGSGVIMSEQGHVLTNHHVISGADEIVVALRDGREATAQLLGTDPEADLALLQIDLPNLPVIPVAEQRELHIGDVVLAIGNPFGVGQTVTLGIISATGRNQLGINTYENYIQTDAAINPGNSGGALVNAYGELVGINTAIFSKSGGSEGIGFAIPNEVATRTLADLARHGQAIRGWLGIEVREATPALLQSLQLPNALTGLIVTGLYEGGPAEQAGLQIGDIMTHINDESAADARAAMNQIGALRPGDRIAIDLLRAGQSIRVEAIAGQRQSQAAG
ncbi:2-alkenal reductase [Bacterioplanes sanyensis]|uniref:2-alkenal reductase n=1 Tax=Bacterioplanes sanyensis TaxID=1249553 RepID=A0A222FI76_9GAMM|nr:trypsin-like peptidase domain-containing protein [Bacterioplanes sanyensis]ASP38757.1 2-alkenal reductase [Bacterioplanes sanyensis]